MRTIKFRGLKIDTGEWVFGNLVNVRDGNTSRYYPCIVISYNHDSFDWIEVKPETVGQFTGLLDKNGKEIYEGDFVEWCFFDCQQREHFLRGNIKWYQGGFILNITENDFENAGYYAISDLSTDTECDVEIFGNVHDNPELLEGGEK